MLLLILQSQVRLKGGAKTGEGRVKVLKGSECVFVCDDRWNLPSSSVVCRELDFGTDKGALTGARMGQGMGRIYMNEVQCHGDEKSLWDCPHKSITAEDCKHMEDVSVICNILYMGFEKTVFRNITSAPTCGEQGITVGCWDLYRHDIDCQWIDITDVKPGNYILQVIINPNFEVAESDFNNAMRCNCKYNGNHVCLHKCHLGDSFSKEAEKEFEHYPGQLNKIS